MSTTYRPHLLPDGIPSRCDYTLMSPAELAISAAMAAVEGAGASAALTHAVKLLAAARGLVADHVEGREPADSARPASAGVGVTEPAWKVSDDRIKRLMIDVGMPNSMSLYQSFKQLENELALTATWRCRVREAGKTDPPQDCNWPFCGCDPYAIKVMDAIEESGIPVSCKCLSPARAGSKPEGDG